MILLHLINKDSWFRKCAYICRHNNLSSYCSKHVCMYVMYFRELLLDRQSDQFNFCYTYRSNNGLKPYLYIDDPPIKGKVTRGHLSFFFLISPNSNLSYNSVMASVCVCLLLRNQCTKITKFTQIIADVVESAQFFFWWRYLKK